jgi:hypothetical protein
MATSSLDQMLSDLKKFSAAAPVRAKEEVPTPETSTAVDARGLGRGDEYAELEGMLSGTSTGTPPAQRELSEMISAPIPVTTPVAGLADLEATFGVSAFTPASAPSCMHVIGAPGCKIVVLGTGAMLRPDSSDASTGEIGEEEDPFATLAGLMGGASEFMPEQEPEQEPVQDSTSGAPDSFVVVTDDNSPYKVPARLSIHGDAPLRTNGVSAG